MARAKHSAGHDAANGEMVRGRAVATLGRGLALVKVGRSAPAAVRPGDETTVLLKKAARALTRPGIDSSAVFRGPNAAGVYSYSVYPQDPTKVIRKAADGSRAIGRLVDGKFRASKS